MPRASKVPREFYETPPGFTRFLLDQCALHLPPHRRLASSSSIFEPASGDGAIERVLRERGYPNVCTNDLDPARPALVNYDATRPEVWNLIDHVDAVIMNPPFSLALPMLEHALRVTSGFVAMHVRISWEEPAIDREHFLRTTPWNGRIVLPRCKFDPTAKGTDSATTVWLVYYPYDPPRSSEQWSVVAPRSVAKESFETAV